MRLINTSTMHLEEFEGQNIPQYAILSHRWQEQEVLFQDMDRGTQTAKSGYAKLAAACIKAAEMDLGYIWIDTCCINKSSSAELSEAINSMYRWYEEAESCMVYLCDVPDVAIERSVWFRRGWTLQEMIAPKSIIFYDKSWVALGSKLDLAKVLSAASGVPETLLTGTTEPADYLAVQKMSWAADRSTTRLEDRAYSLMGLFGVYMPMLYGEGKMAFRRLQEEIIRRSDDTSILLWDAIHAVNSCYAPGPTSFWSRTQRYPNLQLRKSPWLPERMWQMFKYAHHHYSDLSVTNYGIQLHANLVAWKVDVYLVTLDIWNFLPGRTPEAVEGTTVPFFVVRKIPDTERFVRIAGDDAIDIEVQQLSSLQIRVKDTTFWYEPLYKAINIYSQWNGQLPTVPHCIRASFSPSLVREHCQILSPRNMLANSKLPRYSVKHPYIYSLPGVEHIFAAIPTHREASHGHLYLAFDFNFNLICCWSDSIELREMREGIGYDGRILLSDFLRHCGDEVQRFDIHVDGGACFIKPLKLYASLTNQPEKDNTSYVRVVHFDLFGSTLPAL